MTSHPHLQNNNESAMLPTTPLPQQFRLLRIIALTSVFLCVLGSLLFAGRAMAAYPEGSYSSDGYATCGYQNQVDCNSTTSPAVDGSTSGQSNSQNGSTQQSSSGGVIARSIQLALTPGKALVSNAESALRSLPAAQQRAVPYYLWIPLMFIALVLGIIAVLDRRKSRVLSRSIVALKATLTQQKNFMRLILHNLNTPLATIRNSVELLEAQPQQEQQALALLKPPTMTLAAAIESTTSSFQTDEQQINQTNTSIATTTTFNNTLLQWYFIIPLVIFGSLGIAIQIALRRIGVQQPAWQVALQISSGLLAILVFANSLHIVRTSHRLHIILGTTKKTSNQLSQKRWGVIQSLSTSLAGTVQKLRLGAASVHSIQVSHFISSGISSLQKLAYRIEVINNRALSAPINWDIQRVTNEILTRYAHAIEEKHITTDVSGVPQQNIITYVPELYLVTSFVVENAVQFSKSGGSLLIAAQIIDTSLIITVQDNGIGMSETFVQSLFLPFSKSSNDVLTSDQQGIGLSMHVCKTIATRVGGSIDVTSQPDIGTTVKITFPIFSNTPVQH